jgi:hypothetical protein
MNRCNKCGYEFGVKKVSEEISKLLNLKPKRYYLCAKHRKDLENEINEKTNQETFVREKEVEMFEKEEEIDRTNEKKHHGNNLSEINGLSEVAKKEIKILNKVIGILASGLSYSDYKKFETYSMDEVSFSQDTFFRHLKTVEKAIEELIKEEFLSQSKLIINENKNINIVIDGSWMNRRNATVVGII